MSRIRRPRLPARARPRREQRPQESRRLELRTPTFPRLTLEPPPAASKKPLGKILALVAAAVVAIIIVAYSTHTEAGKRPRSHRKHAARRHGKAGGPASCGRTKNPQGRLDERSQRRSESVSFAQHAREGGSNGRSCRVAGVGGRGSSRWSESRSTMPDERLPIVSSNWAASSGSPKLGWLAIPFFVNFQSLEKR